MENVCSRVDSLDAPIFITDGVALEPRMKGGFHLRADHSDAYGSEPIGG